MLRIDTNSCLWTVLLLLHLFMTSAAQPLPHDVGVTNYYYQSHGPTGNRIALDENNGVHFIWTKGVGSSFPRYVYYNYVDSAWQWSGEFAISYNGGGYAQLDIADNNCTLATFHNISTYELFYGVEIFPGFGIFTYFNIPNTYSGYQVLWPYFSLDQNSFIHVLVSTSDSPEESIILYTRSIDNGIGWTDLTPVDSAGDAYYVVISSPVSDKSAMVYLHDLDDSTTGAKDVYYIQSEGGMIWPWQDGKINVTEYNLSDDSIYARTDLDAIYDYDDNLHIMWNAFRKRDVDPAYYVILYHYDIFNGIITEVARSDSGEGAVWGGYNGDHAPISKMSMGIQEESGNIYTLYTAFDSSDISASGYGNGELYAQYSDNSGLWWSAPINLSITPSPNCPPGYCDSELWPCLANKVDGYLHLYWLHDIMGGVSGYYVMYYYRKLVNFSGVNDDSEIPEKLGLFRAYPNPFNARTTIEFALAEPEDVELTIFDITGAKVETISRPRLDAGRHSVVWDAEDVASGVYFARLQAGGENRSIKMVALK